MNLYWLGVLVYIFGAATGAMLTWAWYKDVKRENKELRYQLDIYRDQQYYRD